jgi:uncharacterized protein
MNGSTTASRRLGGRITCTPASAVAVVFGSLIVGQLVGALVVGAAGGDDAPKWVGPVTIVLADAVILGIVALFLRRQRADVRPRDLGLRRAPLGRSVVAVVAAFFSIAVFTTIYNGILGRTEAKDTADKLGGDASLAVVVLVIFAIAVVAPIVEEIVFRGFLFGTLSSRWKSPFACAALTGIVFALSHVLTSEPVALAPLGFVGFVLSLVYWHTGSLLPAIAAHALTNVLAFGGGEDWSWQIPIAAVGAILLAMTLVAPLSRRAGPAPLST